MALALGIYERLVAAIRQAASVLGRGLRLDLAGARSALRAVDWPFLVPLLAGILSAVVLLAGPLTGLLERRPVEMSAVFAGLVAGSVVVAVGDLRRRDGPRLAVALAVATATFVVLGVRGGPATSAALPTVFLAGALAVCAMILPGVSGSFLLLMAGLYEYVLGAVHDRDVVTLTVFATGAGAGLALFATTLDWLLRRHHDTVLAALIGLMAGSLRVLWMWPADRGVGDTRLGAPVAGEVPAAVAAAVVSLVAIVTVARLGRQRSGRGL